MRVSGAVNGAICVRYRDQVPGPTRRLGDMVVLDHLPAPKVDGLATVVETRGASLVYLPPYSPDLTPIELAFSQLKTKLRQGPARPREALAEAMRAATDWLNGPDARNWFTHCGYHVH